VCCPSLPIFSHNLWLVRLYLYFSIICGLLDTKYISHNLLPFRLYV
jgi:hypothetical protein